MDQAAPAPTRLQGATIDVGREAALVRLRHVGTATTLLELGGFTVITDPNFLHRGQRASLGYGLWSKRRTEPTMQPADLPPLDLMLLSHLHGDHFDRVARRGLAKGVPVATTRHAAVALRRWGFARAKALQPWQEAKLTSGDEVLRVVAVPARHGPGVLNGVLPPTTGFVLDLVDRPSGALRFRLYITGDTLMSPDLAEIPARLPDIDAMVIHLGGTRIAGVLLTMDDVQGVRASRLVHPGSVVPIHYDDYRVFRSPLEDFLRRLEAEAPDLPVQVPARGAPITLETRPAPA